MSRKYLYKNIECYQTCGSWQADYVANGKRFALHRACCTTKESAYIWAKDQVDFLNER